MQSGPRGVEFSVVARFKRTFANQMSLSLVWDMFLVTIQPDHVGISYRTSQETYVTH